MEENLTQRDRALLLGVVDGTNKDDYDREFYEKMKEIPPLGVEEVDDQVRRAIVRFVTDVKGEASKAENGGFVILGFLHGYQVGRKLKRDITSK